MRQAEPVNILLVEDNESDAELTIRGLKKSRLTNRITRFSDGQELIDYLFSTWLVSDESQVRNPCIILLDLKLPMMNGIEVLEIIKADVRTKLIPVVVLTSSTEDSDIDACYRLGVNSFIVKPVEFDKFMDSIHELGMYWLLLNHYPSFQNCQDEKA